PPRGGRPAAEQEPEDGDRLLRRAGSEDLLMDDSEYNDEVDNEFVRGRMENVVRVATGDDVRITFGQGFHTDMNGTVQLDPYDPSKDAPAEDRILMMQGGLEHEICHELYYDKAAFAELQRQVDADPSRRPVAYINNILADGHDEWRHKLARPEAYEVIAAHDALFVQHNGSGRWSFDAENQDTWTQVTGAMLYRGLPYYNVPEDKLSDEARSVYHEVAPLVDDAVSGTSWDCLRKANEIYDRLDARGVVPKAPRQDHLKGGAGPASQGAPGTGGGAGGQPGGGGGSAPEDEPLSGDGKGAFEDAQKKKDANSSGAQQEGGGGGQAGDNDPTGDDDAAGSDKSADGAPKEGATTSGERADGTPEGAPGGSPAGANQNAPGGASGASSPGGGGAEGGAKGSGQNATGTDGAGNSGAGGDGAGPRSSGSSLAADPDAARDALESRRRAASSMVAAARNLKPQSAHRNDPAEGVKRGAGALKTFREKWSKNRRLAEDFATAIQEARTETAAPKSRQDSGRLDRRRKRALAVGDEKVFVRRGRARKLDMSVEVLLDVSSSMRDHQEGLRDSAAIVSRGLDVAEIPHEVRGFSRYGNQPLYRAFGEKADWKLGAITASGSTALDAGLEKVWGGFSGRKEKQKLAVVLTDGEPDNSFEAKNQLAALRREGVTVVGLFLRPKEDPNHSEADKAYVKEQTRRSEVKMRDLFGGSVVIMDDVRQLPKVAGKKIVDLLRRS
ncbi:MAG: hypothetical protein M3R38_22815, partial [Actinomycetota bacterium]|nr:hypothetical protein [Actinomycetota bacterium]